ncbi:MAG TPA: hypothetical protein VJQ55_13560 [Candidatus Binatia bacterium]|nr:hypothetical protein [Candidatus Binatia bacterium]
MPGIGEKFDRGVKNRWRELVQIEVVVQRFRHEELSGESGADEVVERLVRVRC